MAIDVSAITSAGALEQRTSFMLNESAGGWIVRSGTLEVFAVKDLNGKPDGPLRPLFSVNAGQAVFGLAGVERLPLTLVARRSVESEVVSWPSGSFRQIDMAGGGSLLADWVAALSLVAARDLVPRNVVTLTHGEHLKVEDEARLVSSKDPLIWVRQTSGSSRFLERPDLAISKGAPPYPLSPFAWIGLQPHSELTIIDSLASLTDEEISRGTALFHRSALICIARTANEADEQERERFRSRADADARAVQTALDDLASPLEPGREHLPAGTDTLDSPLLRACQMIGQRLGVTMRPHPDMVSGRVVKNPVEAIAQASGVRYRRVALKDRWMKKSSEPLLVFRDADERPAALLPRGARGYSIYDPAVGKPAPLDRATAETLNPFAFMFYRPFPNRALAPWDLIEFGFKDGRRELLTIVLMSSSAGILALLVPYVTGVVFDTIIPNAQRTELITVAALLIVAALVTTLLNLGRSFAVLRLQGKLSLSLQSALWDRLLSLPLPFFRQYASGDLAQRSAAFSLIRDVLSGSVLSAILSGIFSVFSFALLFYYSPRLALIATAMTLVALVVTGTAGMMQLRLQRKISMTMGHIAGIVVEFISGIAKFRIAGAERRAFVLWVKEFAEQKRLGFESNTVSTVVAVFNAVYVSACLGVLFLLNSGVEAWRDDGLSTGQFLAFMAAFASVHGGNTGDGTSVCRHRQRRAAVRASFSDSARPAGGQGHSNVPRRAEGRGAGQPSRVPVCRGWAGCRSGRVLSYSTRESTPRSSGRPGAASPRYSACCWDSRPRCRGRSATTGLTSPASMRRRYAGRLAWSCSRARCSPAASWPTSAAPRASRSKRSGKQRAWRAWRKTSRTCRWACTPWFRLAAAECRAGSGSAS